VRSMTDEQFEQIEDLLRDVLGDAYAHGRRGWGLDTSAHHVTDRIKSILEDGR